MFLQVLICINQVKSFFCNFFYPSSYACVKRQPIREDNLTTHIMVASHTRLKAHDQCILGSLNIRKGGERPSSLSTR